MIPTNKFSGVGITQAAGDLRYLKLAGGTMTGALMNSTNGAASTPALLLSGTIFTGGTATTTKPQLLVEPSGATSNNWSTSGTLLGASGPSGFAGNVIDLQINGSRRMCVDSAGLLTLGTFGVSNSQGILLNGLDRTAALDLSAFGNGLAVTTSLDIKGNSCVVRLVDGTVSTRYGYLTGLASGHVGWTANSGPMKWSVGGTHDQTNYERFSVITAAGDYELATEAGGTGTRRNLKLNSANRAAYDASPSATTIRDILISFGLMAAS